jgi:hypothetical protein
VQAGWYCGTSPARKWSHLVGELDLHSGQSVNGSANEPLWSVGRIDSPDSVTATSVSVRQTRARVGPASCNRVVLAGRPGRLAHRASRQHSAAVWPTRPGQPGLDSALDNPGTRPAVGIPCRPAAGAVLLCGPAYHGPFSRRKRPNILPGAALVSGQDLWPSSFVVSLWGRGRRL